MLKWFQSLLQLESPAERRLATIMPQANTIVCVKCHKRTLVPECTLQRCELVTSRICSTCWNALIPR